MRKQFINQLKELSKNVIKMGSIIELSTNEMIEALEDYDVAKAQAIIDRDMEVNLLEEQIERECINIIAQQQPLASDLREVTSIMKIITDIERIADQCADISEYIIQLSKLPRTEKPVRLEAMIDTTKGMVIDVIDAFVEKDLAKCERVIETDDIVDKHFNKIKQELADMMRANSDMVEQGICYVMIVKYLERMADHSTNIAEWVKFIVTGVLTIG
ncbi:MAG: phosphate signaling complex protein PhoU [Clostridiales bacterium]|nr:phosphate signaling complex protein PhoU [Clostridiales bacterium]